jgi:hypothetical protein
MKSCFIRLIYVAYIYILFFSINRYYVKMVSEKNNTCYAYIHTTPATMFAPEKTLPRNCLDAFTWRET